MARKITTTTTAEARREQATALQNSISDQVERLRDTAQWRAFCDMTRGFHRYSLNNLLLIWSQRPTATQVAGFRQWLARGRQVRKGEKAIRIFGYATKKITNETPDAADTDDQTTTDADGTRRRVWYPVLAVFDISQTDPIDPTAPAVTSLVQPLEDVDDLGVLDAITDYLTATGWAVVREPIAGRTQGYTTTDGTRRVVIDADLSPADAAATALHEAAHVVLHTDLPAGEYANHRGVYETEAESVAYIVAGTLGMDTSACSIGYVAGWADADADLIKSTAANVLRAAHEITDAITTGPVDKQAAA